MKNDWNISGISNGISNIVWILGSWVMDFISPNDAIHDDVFFPFSEKRQSRRHGYKRKVSCRLSRAFDFLSSATSHAALCPKEMFSKLMGTQKTPWTKTTKWNRRRTRQDWTNAPSFLSHRGTIETEKQEKKNQNQLILKASAVKRVSGVFSLIPISQFPQLLFHHFRKCDLKVSAVS